MGQEEGTTTEDIEKEIGSGAVMTGIVEGFGRSGPGVVANGTERDTIMGVAEVVVQGGNPVPIEIDIETRAKSWYLSALLYY